MLGGAPGTLGRSIPILGIAVSLRHSGDPGESLERDGWCGFKRGVARKTPLRAHTLCDLKLKDTFIQKWKLSHYLLIPKPIESKAPRSQLIDLKKRYLHPFKAETVTVANKLKVGIHPPSQGCKHCLLKIIQKWGVSGDLDYAGNIWSLLFLDCFSYVLKQVPIYLSCLGECCNAV